jgi:hypothetical protein
VVATSNALAARRVLEFMASSLVICCRWRSRADIAGCTTDRAGANHLAEADTGTNQRSVSATASAPGVAHVGHRRYVVQAVMA